METIRRINGPAVAAVVVAALALALLASSLAGGSAPSAGNSVAKKAKIKKIARQQARKEIARQEPGLSVASAVSAETATNATKAGSARPYAYAKINGATADLDPTYPSRRVSSAQVSSPSAGIYCINLGFTPVTGAVTSTGGDDAAMIGFASQTSGCPAGTEVLVRNWDFGDAALANESFLIQLSN